MTRGVSVPARGSGKIHVGAKPVNASIARSFDVDLLSTTEMNFSRAAVSTPVSFRLDRIQYAGQ
jgi:hypothetical protein